MTQLLVSYFLNDLLTIKEKSKAFTREDELTALILIFKKLIFNFPSSPKHRKKPKSKLNLLYKDNFLDLRMQLFLKQNM